MKKVLGFGPHFLATLLAILVLLAVTPATLSAGPILGPAPTTPDVLTWSCGTNAHSTPECYTTAAVMVGDDMPDANVKNIGNSSLPGAKIVGAKYQGDWQNEWWGHLWVDFLVPDGYEVTSRTFSIQAVPGSTAVFNEDGDLRFIPGGTTQSFDVSDWATAQLQRFDFDVYPVGECPPGKLGVAAVYKITAERTGEIPEPTTTALVGIGFVGLAFWRRRTHRP
jgi:hypothetical protein